MMRGRDSLNDSISSCNSSYSEESLDSLFNFHLNEPADVNSRNSLTWMSKEIERSSFSISESVFGDDIYGDSKPGIEVENLLACLREEGTAEDGEEKFKSEHFTPEKNFFADSPYYNASVIREINYTKIVSESMNDIIQDSTQFVKAGRQMVDATKRLSASCKLNVKSKLISAEGYQLKQQAIGKSLCNLLLNLGNVLDEIAEAQEQMCESFETSLNADLKDELQRQFKTATSRRSETLQETDNAEKDLSNYLNEKGPSFRISLNSRSSHSYNNEKELTDTLNKVYTSQIQSEISRFRLMKKFVESKDQRRYALCSKFSFLIENIHKRLGNCTKKVASFLPLCLFDSAQMITESTNRYNVAEKKENAIKLVLLSSNVDLMESEDNDHNPMCKLMDNVHRQSSSSATTCYSESIENSIKLWELPFTLAKAWRHCRFGTSGVEVEGWLYLKKSALISGHTWVRDWYMIDNGVLNKLCPTVDRAKFVVEKICDIVLTNVRDINDSASADDRFCFEIRSSCSKMKPMIFKAKGPHDLDRWVNGYRSHMGSQFSLEDNHASLNKCHGESKLSVNVTRAIRRATVSDIFDSSATNFCKSSFEDMDSVEQSPIMQKIMEQNPSCAECTVDNPSWCSLNLGILICINCSGIHRSLGVHISKVRSLTMDSVSDHEAGIFLSLGNQIVNSIWEEEYSVERFGIKRPAPGSCSTVRKEWITSKYIEKRFLTTKKKDIKCQENNNDVGQVVSSSILPSLSSLLASVEIQFQQRNKELYQEAKKGNIAKIASLIALGVNINWKNDEENSATPLEACWIKWKHAKERNIKWKYVTEGNKNQDEDDSEKKFLICSEYLKQNGAKSEALLQGKINNNKIDTKIKD